MNFKIGDKVKFLNEKGGGVISKIINHAMVNVATDDGFELPVMKSELILIDSKNAGERFFEEHYSVEKNYRNTKAHDSAQNEIKKNQDIKGFPEGISVAYIPMDQKALIIGNVEVMLINNSSFSLIFSLFFKEGLSFVGSDFGSVDPYSVNSIQFIDREQLKYFTDAVFQFIFFKEKLPQLFAPMQCPLKTKLMKFVKEDNFEFNAGLSKKLFSIKICGIPGTDTEKTAPEIHVIPSERLVKDKYILKHVVEDGFAEVDLHIEALCENPETLRKHEKLQIQIDYFNRCLESAIAENIDRVIFIHGVGAGVLKVEISNQLELYEFVEYFDASIAKYGVGATEVLIHHTKK
jgi:hypothetical protein